MYNKTSLFLILLYFFSHNIAFSQSDTCKILVWQHDPAHNYFNPDSVIVDTCASTEEHEVLYAYKWYYIFLPESALIVQQAPRDSLIYRNWRDIDTNFTELRNGFQMIENMFSPFIMRKEYPDIIDKSYIASRSFLIKFEKYCNIDSVIYYLKLINGLYDAFYDQRNTILSSNYLSEPSFELGNLKLDGIKSKLVSHSVEYHKNSIQWNLFSIHAPLAWEVSKGDRDIVIQVADEKFYYINNYSYQTQYREPGHGVGLGLYQDPDQSIEYPGDLYMEVSRRTFYPGEIYSNWTYDGKVTNTVGGNVIYNEIKTVNIDIYEPDVGDNLASVAPIKIFVDGHGLVCMGVINPKLNGKGIAGICPNCMTIATESNKKPSLFDTRTDLGGKQPPHVMTQSTTELGISVVTDAMKNDTVVIVTGHSERIDDPLISKFKDDVKPICVWPIKDGKFFRNTTPYQNADYKCVPWDGRIKLFREDGWDESDYWSCDGETGTFPDRANPDYTNEKYDFTDEEPDVPRKSNKKNASGDVVAPARMIIFQQNGINSNGIYTINDDSWSWSIPHVAAVVGLMRSVDRYLGCDYPADNKSLNPLDVSRKAYDIITFTADKIPTRNDPTKDYSYKQQLHNDKVDPLDRYWSPEMFYGKVNAFRCVAHSIRNTGKPKNDPYPNIFSDADDVLNFQPGSFTLYKQNGYSVDGKQLIHLGAYNSSNQKVLEYGGNIYPGEPDYDNCHGTTIVNKDLSVGLNNILVIDGILSGNSSTISTTNNGKILITGFMKDVALYGLIKTDNLKIFNSSKITINTIADDPAEAYGYLDFNNSSELIIYNGELILQPGCNIKLNTTKDIIIDNGGILSLNYNSSIQDLTTGQLRKIVIKPGGTLKIKEGALTEINCKVIAEPNSQFIVEKDGLLKLRKFEIQDGAKLQMNEGSRLYLTESVMNPCEGEIEIFGGLIIDNVEKSTIIGGDVIYCQEDGETFVPIPSSNPDITLKPGGRLTVQRKEIGEENCKAEIKCKLIAENSTNPTVHSMFIVNPDVDLKLKSFQFGEGSKFQVKEGSSINLTEYNYVVQNICNGLFEVVGTETKPSIISGKAYIQINDVNKYDNFDATVNLNHAYFDNVPIKINNAKILDINGKKQIANCTFSANLNFYASNKTYPILLDIYIPWLYDENPIYSFEINNCNFIDNDKGLLIGETKPTYEIIGLNVSLARKLTVSNSNFDYLKYCLSTGLFGSANIHHNTFNNFNFGIYNYPYNPSRIEYNTFNTIEPNKTNIGQYGCYVSYNNEIYSNVFNNVYHGIQSFWSDEILLCYNYFDEFSRAVYTFKSKVILGTEYKRTFLEDDALYWWGNNDFSHQSKIVFNTADKIDIEFDEENSILLSDGRNTFAHWTDYHLKGVGTISVKGNKWLKNDLGECEVKHNPTLNIINNSDICNSYNDQSCGSSFVPPIVHLDTCWGARTFTINGVDVWNDGNWTEESFTPEEWQEIINQAITALGDSITACDCRYKLYLDLMEAVRLSGDKSDETYQKLSALFERSKYWCMPILNYWEMMGLLYEYFDKYNNAIDIYVDIVTNYTSFTIDSIIANWRLLYINAIQGDTTYGFVYDSLMRIYYNRVLADLDRFPYQYSDTMMIRDSIHYRRPPLDVAWHWESYTTLGQNIPNPFSDETEIPFYLKKPAFVKLAVYDAFGREIAVLVNEYRQSGKHSVIYHSPYLYNGVYFYRLEAGGIIETRKMQLIK